MPNMDTDLWAKLCDARDTLCSFCENDECENCQVTRLLFDAANEASEAGIIGDMSENADCEEGQMKAIVYIAIDGRLDVEVTVPDGLSDRELLESARAEAMAELADADITEMDIVGGNAVNVTLPDGRLLDF